MQRIIISSIISFLIIPITVISVNQWSTFRFVFTDNSSILPIYFITLFLIIYSKKYYYNPIDNKYLSILFVYVGWIIICIIRGAFVADNRAEWINLLYNAFALLMPLIALSTTNPHFVQKIFSTWFKYIIPIYLVFILFFMQLRVSGFFLNPFIILLIGFSVLPAKWKWISLACLIIVFINLDARSNVIKYGIAFLFGLVYYKKDFLSAGKINYISKIFMLLPIILFLLGIFGIFNVFRMDDYIKENFVVEAEIKGEVKLEDLKADTRTFLYIEVLTSALQHDYILFGRTPSRGNDTNAFLSIVYNSGRAERNSNEAAILNVFTWTGIVGVILYFFVFLTASHLAINRANNYFIRILGLYVSFRWVFCWVEDLQRFDILNITLWIMITMCFSSSFRLMNDEEIIIWIRGIFNWRYRDKSFSKVKSLG